MSAAINDELYKVMAMYKNMKYINTYLIVTIKYKVPRLSHYTGHILRL